MKRNRKNHAILKWTKAMSIVSLFLSIPLQAAPVVFTSGNYTVNGSTSPSPSPSPSSPSPSPAAPSPAGPPCELRIDDPNRNASPACTCKTGYLKVPWPNGTQPPPANSITVALNNQVDRALAKGDYRLADLLMSVLDSLSPESAQAQTVINCAAGMCSKDILELCTGNNCTKTIRYGYTGAAAPPACNPIPANCQVNISCGAWTTPTMTSSERTCTINDNCFGKIDSCYPFNQSSFNGKLNVQASPNPPSGDIRVVGIDNSGAMSPGTQVCVPDCENFGSVNSGLKYVWAGPNQGKCACPIGYVWDKTTNKCKSPLTILGCDDGTISGVPSEVSPFVTGHDYAERFHNTVNKKLGCCLNGMGSTATMAKFDCVDNSFGFTPTTTFDQMWSQADSGNGEQIWAVELMGSNNKPITGFYSTDGKRGEQFTEFADVAIQPGRLGAKVNAGQTGTGLVGFSAVGSPLPTPSGAGWNEMVASIKTRINNSGVAYRGAPQTLDEQRAFPILVRAFAVYSCPRNPVTANSPLRSLEALDGSGNLIGMTCATAATVTIHLQVRQIFEIGGVAPLKTYDTVVDQSQVSGISVDQLITEKYGPGCGPGRVLQGSACVWE